VWEAHNIGFPSCGIPVVSVGIPQDGALQDGADVRGHLRDDASLSIDTESLVSVEVTLSADWTSGSCTYHENKVTSVTGADSTARRQLHMCWLVSDSSGITAQNHQG